MTSNILPILEFDELIELFEYTNHRAARRAIKAGTFPVPVFEMAGRTVAHVDAVELYFSEQRDASMAWLKKRYGIHSDSQRLPTSPRLDLYRQLGQQERRDLDADL
jgi:hypothetical protein